MSRQTVNINTMGKQLPKSMPQNFLSEQGEETSILGEESHGVALKAAKDKWNELGPLRLDDIVANS